MVRQLSLFESWISKRKWYSCRWTLMISNPNQLVRSISFIFIGNMPIDQIFSEIFVEQLWEFLRLTIFLRTSLNVKLFLYIDQCQGIKSLTPKPKATVSKDDRWREEKSRRINDDKYITTQRRSLVVAILEKHNHRKMSSHTRLSYGPSLLKYTNIISRSSSLIRRWWWWSSKLWWRVMLPCQPSSQFTNSGNNFRLRFPSGDEKKCRLNVFK